MSTILTGQGIVRLFKNKHTQKVSVHASPWVNKYWIIAKDSAGKVLDWFLTRRIERDTLTTIIHQTRTELNK